MLLCTGTAAAGRLLLCRQVVVLAGARVLLFAGTGAAGSLLWWAGAAATGRMLLCTETAVVIMV